MPSARVRLAVASLAVVELLAAACAHHAPAVRFVTPSPSGDLDAPVSDYWVAVLSPPTSTLPDSATTMSKGRADISIQTSTQKASVLLFLTGLDPSQTYLWHIRLGVCSAPERAGPSSEYAPLAVDSHGRGTATGTFPFTDPALNFYHIDVHTAASGGHPTNDPRVACGEITARNR
jgi:hypothetical protein